MIQLLEIERWSGKDKMGRCKGARGCSWAGRVYRADRARETM